MNEYFHPREHPGQPPGSTRANPGVRMKITQSGPRILLPAARPPVCAAPTASTNPPADRMG